MIIIKGISIVPVYTQGGFAGWFTISLATHAHHTHTHACMHAQYTHTHTHPSV